jgi:hypothetical protein
VLANQGRSGLRNDIELSYIDDHLFDHVVPAGVAHRRMNAHTSEDHMHANEMGAPALGQAGGVSRPPLPGWAGVEKDGDRLRINRHGRAHGPPIPATSAGEDVCH